MSKKHFLRMSLVTFLVISAFAACSNSTPNSTSAESKDSKLLNALKAASALPTPDPNATVTPTPDPNATVTPTPDPNATVTPTPDPNATVTPAPSVTPSSAPLTDSRFEDGVEGTLNIIINPTVPTRKNAPAPVQSTPTPDPNATVTPTPDPNATVSAIAPTPTPTPS